MKINFKIAVQTILGRNFFKFRCIKFLLIALLLSLSGASLVNASGGADPAHNDAAMTFLWIAVILMAAKISSLVERFGQPSVLGELVVGVIMGNLVLLGINAFEPIKHDSIIAFLAELGVVILLFQIGLESNVHKMCQIGLRAFLVAVVGVVAPFILGTYIVGPWLLPGLSFNAYLFLGATLTATSVGITARVFRDIGKLQNREAQIILGAAVIDDVLGLIILAVVSAIVVSGAVNSGVIAWITVKAIIFLVGAIILGQFSAARLGKMFSKINDETGMKLTLALSFCLIFAYLASKIGLAPIIGAFAAGLVLDPVYFRSFKDPKIVEDVKNNINDCPYKFKKRILEIMKSHSLHHIEYKIKPIGHFLIPLFFVMTGMAVNMKTLFNLPMLLVALGITVAAILGKIIAGAAAGNDVNKSIVGWGMVPRGEVGLIFATAGRGLGVVSEEIFSVIVIVVILTTLLPPPILMFLLKREASGEHNPLIDKLLHPVSVLAKKLGSLSFKH